MSFKLVYFAFICCVIFNMEIKSYASNILGLFTSQHTSHMLMYMGVMKSLLNRGHNLTIISVLPTPDKLRGSLRVIQLKLPPVPEPRLGIFRQFALAIANSRVFDDINLKSFLREENRFDLVIMGYFFNDYQLGIAAHYNCPVVVLWTTQPFSFVNRFVGNPNGWWYVPQPFLKSQAIGVRGMLHGLFEIIYQQILDIAMNQVYVKHFPPPKYPALDKMRNNVSLILCNHHFSEGPVAARLPTVIEVGGIQIEDIQEIPTDLKEFMDSAEGGVIYFSLGTVASVKHLRPTVVESFIKVFSKLPHRVLWKIDYFPYNISNIITKRWFPQSDILNHPNVKLFITHAGKGSTIEAIYHAVPVIAVPIFGDQFGDSNRLVSNGFGLQLQADTITEVTLHNCILEVLNNSSYARNIRAASQIYRDREITPKANAVYWIEYVLRHRGAPHMHASTKTMHLMEYLNIDVYLFCICAMYAIMAASRILIFTTYSYFKNL